MGDMSAVSARREEGIVLGTAVFRGDFDHGTSRRSFGVQEREKESKCR